MTNIRTLAFAGLTLIASAGAAFAASHASQVQPNEYQSYYQNQQAAFPANNGMSDDYTSNSPSCYRGVLPWRIQSCGVE